MEQAIKTTSRTLFINCKMPEYTVLVIIPNSGNKEIAYSLEFTGTHEDYPEDYFAVEEHRSRLRNSLQEKTAMGVNDTKIDQLINTWIQDIKQGLHRTTIRLEMTTELTINDKPNIVNNTSNKTTFFQAKRPEKNIQRSTIEQKPITEQRSIKNQRDF
jgi:hypothetical protein